MISLISRAFAHTLPSMRLFTALTLPPPIRQRLEEIQTIFRPLPHLQSGVSWTRPENLHVTLKFLGDIEDQHLANLTTGLGKIEVPPMTFTVSRFLCLPHHGPARVLAAALSGDIAPLARLFAQIDATVRPLGVRREARDYKPHISLARFKNPSNRHTSQVLARVIDPFLLPTAPFSIESFELFESKLTPEGPVYRNISSFPGCPPLTLRQ